MEPVDNIINNNDVVHETSSRFEEIEKQFNELKDFLGNVFQKGTKKIKESFINRSKQKITIDDLDIGSHPVIIEKFANVEFNNNEIKERLRGPISLMSEENKQKTIKYIQNLTKLTNLYITD